MLTLLSQSTHWGSILLIGYELHFEAHKKMSGHSRALHGGKAILPIYLAFVVEFFSFEM